jgi:hypothetical protein
MMCSWESGAGVSAHGMTGKNVWRLSKVYGKWRRYPTLKPHDLQRAAPMEVLGPRNALEWVRAPLGPTRAVTTQTHATILPPQTQTGDGIL